MVVLRQLNQFHLQTSIMKKIIIEGFVILFLFFALWFNLGQIDWMSVFNVHEATDKTEEKLGELFWENFQRTESENKNPLVINSLDSIVSKICTANRIERSSIKLHVLMKDEVNAFALPHGHLIVYSGLIEAADNQEELAGVICHEIAHIELNHVMEKLMKEVGLSILISMTTGNNGSEMVKETAKILASSAFDRNSEKDADLKAVDYLATSNINPEPFAHFLYKLGDAENEVMQYLSWVSTHPDSKERGAYIIEYSRDKTSKNKAILTQESWKELKENLKEQE